MMARRKSAPAVFPDLTAEQTASLRTLVRDYGSAWSSELTHRWLRGDYQLPGLLALRTTHGPAWMQSFVPPRDWYYHPSRAL